MKRHYREITYLIGDSAEKRRMMRSCGKGVARALNDEVSAVCRVKGKDYYVVGKHPFGAFTVWQYLRYERALLSPSPITKKEAKALLKSVGVKTALWKKLGRLPFAERRLVQAAARMTSDTVTVAINLDGAPYSRALRASLRRATKRLGKKYAVWVAVTDSRLVPRFARTLEITPNTVYTSRKKKYRSSVVSRASLVSKLKACFADPEPLEKGKVVCVSDC